MAQENAYSQQTIQQTNDVTQTFQQPPAFHQSPIVIQSPTTPTASGTNMQQALGVRTTKCLSILLLICGVLMFLLQLICTVIVEANNFYHIAHEAGTGIWCGILITLTGVIGCCSASKRSNALVITFLICSILCALLFAPIMIGTTGGDLAHDDFCKYSWHDESNDCSKKPALLSMTILMLLDALVVFGISIWAIATNAIAIQKAKACGSCCACCYESTPTPQAPIVVYLPANQMQATPGQPMQTYMFQNQGAPALSYVPQVVYNGYPANSTVPPPSNEATA